MAIPGLQTHLATSAEESKHQQDLEALFCIGRLLAAGVSFEQTAKAVVEELAKFADVHWAILRVPDDRQHGLRLAVASGKGARNLPFPPVLPYGRGLMGVAFQRGEAVIGNEFHKHSNTTLDMVFAGVKSTLVVDGGASVVP